MKKLKPTLIGTAVATILLISYVHAYVYPRTEGEKLEAQVKTLKEDIRDDLKVIRKDIKTLLQRTKK